MQEAKVAKLEEVSERRGVAETLADAVRALLGAVEVGDELLQEVTPDLHLRRENIVHTQKSSPLTT